MKEFVTMKKPFFTILLALLVLPAFAQDMPPARDEYARFQGVWYRIVNGEELPCYIFSDNIYTEISDYFTFGIFTVDGSKMNLIPKKDYSEEGITPSHDETITLQFIFSGNKLILADDKGNILTLLKMEL
jgi:hypothetical protein